MLPVVRAKVPNLGDLYMKKSALFTELENQRLGSQNLAELITADRETRAAAVEGLYLHHAHSQNICAEALRLVAKSSPCLIYKYFNSFSDLLTDPNPVVRWEMKQVLAALAPVDCQNMLGQLPDEFSWGGRPRFVTLKLLPQAG